MQDPAHGNGEVDVCMYVVYTTSVFVSHMCSQGHAAWLLTFQTPRWRTHYGDRAPSSSLGPSIRRWKPVRRNELVGYWRGRRLQPADFLAKFVSLKLLYNSYILTTIVVGVFHAFWGWNSESYIVLIYTYRIRANKGPLLIKPPRECFI